MKLGERPIEERVDVLKRCGLRVVGFDSERGMVYIRVPRHEGVPLEVDSAGDITHAWASNERTEFSLARRRRAVQAAEDLLADLFGRELNQSLRQELEQLGWKQYTKVGWPLSKGYLFVLIEHPRPVAARVNGRLVDVEDALGDGEWVADASASPGAVEPLTDLTRAIIQRRLGELRRDVARVNAAREQAPQRHIDDFLPPPARRRPGPLGKSGLAADGLPQRPWTEVFRRTALFRTCHPRFYLRDSRGYLRARSGYEGEHDHLDRILDLCGEFGFAAKRWGSSSPWNADSYNVQIWFLDGGLRVAAGNYFVGEPAQGAYVVGTLALRWLLWHLGCTQPRRLSGEARRPTEEEIVGLAAFPFLPEGSGDHEPWPFEG